jgi:hypothetical protein
MRKIMALLIAIILLSISIQSVVAQDTCRIIVNGGQAVGASVEVWKGSQLVCSGNADNYGVFRAYPMNMGSTYTVIVNYSGRHSEKDVIAKDPINIDI